MKKRPRVIVDIFTRRSSAEFFSHRYRTEKRHPRIHEREARAEDRRMLIYVLVVDAETA